MRLKRTWRYRLEHVQPEDTAALNTMRYEASHWATCAVGETFRFKTMNEFEQMLWNSPLLNPASAGMHTTAITKSGHAFDACVAKMAQKENFHTNREYAIAHLQDIQWQKSRLEHLGIKF